jgi:hypothetical protein
VEKAVGVPMQTTAASSEVTVRLLSPSVYLFYCHMNAFIYYSLNFRFSLYVLEIPYSLLDLQNIIKIK